MISTSLYNIKFFKKYLQSLLNKVVCALVDSGVVENNILLYFSARLGSVDAQYKLALIFRYGKSSCRSNDLFEYWAYAAYDQGHIGVNFELAKYFRLLGPGGRKLSEEVFIKYIDLAYEHFEVAAEAGIVEAQELLADMHRIGEGVGVPDWDGAIYWYNEAASNGSESAQKMRDYMIDSLGLSEWFPDSFKIDWFSDKNEHVLSFS